MPLDTGVIKGVCLCSGCLCSVAESMKEGAAPGVEGLAPGAEGELASPDPRKDSRARRTSSTFFEGAELGRGEFTGVRRGSGGEGGDERMRSRMSAKSVNDESRGAPGLGCGEEEEGEWAASRSLAGGGGGGGGGG
nr:unnamed protein product [Digitaria exilis]